MSWLTVAACNGGTSPPARAENPGDAESPRAVEPAADLVDVNDVSILFAPRGGRPFPEISVEEGEQGGLWRAQDFDALMAFAQNGLPGVPGSNPEVAPGGRAAERADWRIVAARFDPCAPALAVRDPSPGLTAKLTEFGVPAACLVQFRLVAQPFQGNRDVDFAAHLVFTLPSTDGVLPLLRAVKRASEAAGAPTDGVPLGVHPGLAAGSTAVATAVRQLVLQLPAQSVARTSALMGLRAGPEPWVFLGGRMEAKPEGGFEAFSPLPIFSFGVAGGVFHQRLSFKPGDPRHVIPEPQQPIRTSPLFDDDSTDANLVFHVDDPARSNIFETDCVSCHTSTARIYALDLDSTSERVPTPVGVTAYAPRSVLQASGETGRPPHWNVRNFGWFQGHPTISLRTVNETAEAVQLVNLEMVSEAENPERRHGPGPDCSAVDEATWTCFVKTGGSDCLDACVAAP